MAAFRLVLHWLVNIYISGGCGRIAETTAVNLSESASKEAANYMQGTGWFDNTDWADTVEKSMPLLFDVTGKVFGKIVGKVAEGGVNAYLAYRLGRRAIEEFEALRVKAN